jgi:outer membrane protein insertion porin family
MSGFAILKAWYMNKRGNQLSAAILLFLLLFLAGCRSTRFLPENEVLITQTRLKGVPPSLSEEAKAYIPRELRPNSRINLFIYHLANTQNGAYRQQDIRKVGEPPRLLDSALIGLTTEQISRFLFNKGYFKASVEPQIQIQRKKAQITYQIDMGPMYRFGKIDTHIEDTTLAQHYHQYKDRYTRIHEGERFDTDSLLHEREHTYHLLRSLGYFDYLRQYMRIDVDTTQQAHTAHLQLLIENPAGQVQHQRYKIGQTQIRIEHEDGEKHLAQPHRYLSPDQLQVIDFTGKFRPKSLSRYVFQQSGDLYNSDLENLTYDRFYELNSFRSVTLQHQKNDQEKTIDVQYSLIPRARMANQIEGEYTFSAGMSGFNIGNTFSHRNLFGGSEQLEIKLRYGMLFDGRIEGNLIDRLFNSDAQMGINVTVPKLLVPFRVSNVSKHGLPRTLFTSNLQIFDQRGTYSNRYLTNTISYQWAETKYRSHSYSPLVLEYRLGKLNSDFAQGLIDQGFLLYVRSNNRAYFGLGSQYVYTQNHLLLNQLEDFKYFRGALDLSGNILQLASQIFDFDRNADGERQLFGVPYIQYAKAEIDWRWYKHFGGHRQFILRINPGIAIPYGNNSSLLIFEKSFFGGGMNGIRAWQARTLGPGNYNRSVLDPDLRLNLRNLDQLGELKLEANAELRFLLLQDFWGAKLKGAIFTDMGNIWRLSPNELNPGGHFRSDRFLQQIAIGTGGGLRFDMDYFVLRLDVGLKVKDPQFEGAQQWVIKDLFDIRAFKRSYALTNAPDRYHFFQYNFGIGMPF